MAGKKMGRGESADTLYRHWLILKLIPRRTRISIAEIVNRLEREHSYTKGRRMIERDLEKLSRVFPLVADECRPKGWSWARDAAPFDIPGMDPLTAMTFSLVKQFIAHLAPRSAAAALDPYFDLAQSNLAKMPTDNLRSWLDKVRVTSRNEMLQPPRVPDEVMAGVYEALYSNMRCLVAYRKKSRQKPTEYEVTPLGLVFVDKVPYLVATLWDYPDIKQLPLTRIQSVTPSDKPATPPKGFTLQGYIDSGEFRYPVSDKMLKLKILMETSRAKHLEETPLAADQKIVVTEDGRVLISAGVRDTRQLRFWLNGLGADVEVLEPKTLRDELRRNAAELWKRYK